LLQEQYQAVQQPPLLQEQYQAVQQPPLLQELPLVDMTIQLRVKENAENLTSWETISFLEGLCSLS
jgi:hypothetical protein